ncbi:MAG: type II toxin-antitoxin system Phd/YefM family antitoxin [Elusimicrobiota bacterium]
MEKIVPISELQSHAKSLVEQARKTDEPIIITQRGRAAAVVMSYETYEGWMATQDEMRYPDWKTRLKRAQKEHGKGQPLETYLKRRIKH